MAKILKILKIWKYSVRTSDHKNLIGHKILLSYMAIGHLEKRDAISWVMVIEPEMARKWPKIAQNTKIYISRTTARTELIDSLK